VGLGWPPCSPDGVVVSASDPAEGVAVEAVQERRSHVLFSGYEQAQRCGCCLALLEMLASVVAEDRDEEVRRARLGARLALVQVAANQMDGSDE
jgi:hypothetical protein